MFNQGIFVPPGLDSSVVTDITTLKNNEIKVLYYAEISAAAGTISIPTNATVILDQFYDGGDAIVETIVNGYPSQESPRTAGGAVVAVTSFDTSGNYTLSGTPSSFPVALLYILRIKAIDYHYLDVDNIIVSEGYDNLTTGLPSAQFYVGNSNNIATAVTMSGDGTLSNIGVFTLSNSGVSANTYNLPTITIDAKGRITNASSVTTSAGMAAIITDETGTGYMVFSDSPVFTTQITTPQIVGGTGINSSINYVASTHVSPTSTAVAHQFLVDGSGAVSAGKIYHNSNWNIGNAVNTGQRITRIGQDTAFGDFGSLIGTTSNFSLYINTTSPSASNYSFQGNATSFVLNAPATTGSILLNNNATNIATFGRTSFTSAPVNATTGAITTWTFTGPSHSGQTAGTEVPTVNWNMSASMQHASNTAITTQRDFLIQARTHTFATSGGIITTAATLAISGAPIAGTNASITNPHAFWVQSGQSHFDGNIEIGDTFNFIVQTATGSKFGTAADQKIGKWGVTPIIQPASANQAALTNSTGGTYDGTLEDVSTVGVADPAKINNNFTDVFTLLNQLRADLVSAGNIKGSA